MPRIQLCLKLLLDFSFAWTNTFIFCYKSICVELLSLTTKMFLINAPTPHSDLAIEQFIECLVV